MTETQLKTLNMRLRMSGIVLTDIVAMLERQTGPVAEGSPDPTDDQIGQALADFLYRACFLAIDIGMEIEALEALTRSVYNAAAYGHAELQAARNATE